MPEKHRSLQRQIEVFLENPKMEGKSIKTKKSTKQALTRGAQKLREAGLELNPDKMGRREMLFLRDHAYGGGTYYRNWSMTFWRGFMKFCGNHVFDELDFKMTKCPRKSVRWLSEENDDLLWEFILTMASPIQGAVLTLENGLGLRRIELERLTIHDIQNGRIHVLGKGRNGGKWRTLTLDRISTHAIEVWMEERSKLISEARELDPHVVVPNKLLIHRHGKTLTGYGSTGIDKVVKNAARQISAKTGRPFVMSNHDLRRTMGRRQWKAGTPIETISKMLGHTNPIQTMEYIGVDQDDMKAAIDTCMEGMMRRVEARREAART